MSIGDFTAARTGRFAPFARLAMTAANDELDDFFENSAIGLSLFAGDGTILRANRAELQMLGYPLEDYVGRDIREFHVDRNTIDDMFARLRRGEQIDQVPARLRAKDGSIRDVLITATARLSNGELMDARSMTIDVTGQVRTEELLRQHDQRLTATYDHAGIGIVEVDAEGRLLRVNAQLAALMGYSAAELVGRSIFDETAVEDVERDYAQFKRQVAGEIDGYSIEKRLRRKDGGYVWAAMTSSSVRDAEGRFLYAVRVQHDINDRKQAEEALARRVAEQEALYEFTERLQHAGSLAAVYEPALEAIIRALRCDRASILLFDQSGVMRFVAWRALSDNYRRAVDGHSPWSRDAKDPKPIGIEDIDRAELPESLKETVRAEGITALAFIPIQESGRLLGKFMVYYDLPHVFTELENHLALTIARQLGFAVERIRAEQALRESETHKSAILQSALDGIITMDEKGRILEINPTAQRLLRRPQEQMAGKTVLETMVPERLRAQYRRSPKSFVEIAEGTVVGSRLEVPLLRGDGSEFDAEVSVSASPLPTGQVLFTAYLRDVTERRHAERAAQQLASIVESSDDAIVSKDLNGTIMTWNAGAERLFGYKAAEVIGKPITILIPPDRRGEEPGILARIRRGERIDHYETVRQRKDGSLFDVSLTVSPMRDANGAIVTASKIARDVTERRRAARAAQYLAAIVESSDDAIISKDLNGIITTWNRGAERLFGYKTAEVIGKPITILIPPDRLDEEPGILARIRRGERIDHYETVRRRKDGSLVDISLTVSPMRDDKGAIVGASKIARDTTERKQAEAKLRDSEQQLKEILAAIPAAIYTTDAQGKITYYNEAAVELAGRTPTIGSDEWCVTWKLYWPDGRPMRHDECPMAVALKEGRPIRNAEAIAERPDGSRVPFIPYPTPLRDWTGKVVGAINMLVDVSERKQAETQQRVLFNELNHRVKNNMQTLQSLLHLAAKQTRSAEAQTILDEASRRVAAMAAAQQVLYGTTDATRFSAREFLDTVCQTVRQTFPANPQIDCESAPVELSNEAAMPLALILNELLTNAIKHGLIGQTEGTIRAGLTKDGDDFVLSVEDDGPGFDVTSVRNRSSGLRLVQGLARQLCGRFDVTTNSGTRCAVRFPQRGTS
jgi:PAS domain S-box-containing protein